MPETASPFLLWFRQDFRLADNPALSAAAERGGQIVAAYVLDDDTPGKWKLGGAARWWLHHSLTALGASLDAHGIPLVLRRGPAKTIIPKLAKEIGARAVFWNRCYEPFVVERDEAIAAALGNAGIDVGVSAATLLSEPGAVLTKSGQPFKVFTAFLHAVRKEGRPPRPLAAPRIKQTPIDLKSDALKDWKLLPEHPNWASSFGDDWSPGEAGARDRLRIFLDEALARYPVARDRPGAEGVSRLSPHLHWGEISVRQIWHAVELRSGNAADTYLKELIWRDFAHQLLWQFPDLPDKPFTPSYAGFPWRNDSGALKAWQKGQTGYPFVDAGMRQLWTTGWMHNRVRMVAASFLVKHLLLPWQDGEAWFWDCLVDADLANNAMNWQWVAGSGADAAPYFRIFNPALQGEKFDKDGAYVRRWVPEVANLPDKFLHRPWEAPADVLTKAAITVGETYPRPIVDHDTARRRALDALKTIQK